MDIENTKTVWVAWANTDRIEGRGYQYPYAVAESYEAADRLGKGSGVQGSNCHVTENLAVKINNQWLVPGRIFEESSEDKNKRDRREAKESVLKKARDFGLTDDEIAILQQTGGCE